MLGLGGNRIASETRLEKRRVPWALNITRGVMLRGAPDVLRARQRLMRPVLKVSGGVREKRDDLKVSLINERIRRALSSTLIPGAGILGLQLKDMRIGW